MSYIIRFKIVASTNILKLYFLMKSEFFLNSVDSWLALAFDGEFVAFSV